MSVSRKQRLYSTIAIMGLVICGSDLAAQPRGNFGGFGGIGGFGGFGGRPEDLLRRDDVRKELELVDKQIEKLDELAERRREGGREAFSGLQDLSQEERAKKMREIFEERAKESQNEIDKILLPHQSKRLAQLAVQFRSRGGTSSALMSSQIAEDLGITDQQKEKIREKAAELQKELNEKIAELRKEMQEEILGELTAKQRSQWKEMVGDPFEFQAQQFGNLGGRNNGGGTFGGRQPGNRNGTGRNQRGNRRPATE